MRLKKKGFLSWRLKGHITVMTALIFTCILGLITVLIKYSIHESVMARVDNACLLSSESAFAGYSSDIFKKYGILVLTDRASADKRFQKVLEDNLAGSGVALTNRQVSEEVFMTDNGGDFFIRQAVDYMKTEGSIELATNTYKKLEKYFTKDKPLIEESSHKELNILEGLSEEKSELNEEEKKSLEEYEKQQRENWGELEELPDGEELKKQEDDKELKRSFFNIRRIFKKNICNLVLSESKISDRSLDIESWTSNEKIKDRQVDFNDTRKWKELGKIDEIIFKEYLILKMKSYLEVGESSNKKKGLSYETEYILFGKKNDKDNLAACMRRIVLMREAVNMAYLVSKPDKKSQAQGLAIAIFGFTLNPMIIRAATYGILAVWAYGESICDLKAIFKGDKVPPIKNDETWNTSLSGLLSLKLEPKKYKGVDGLDYKSFLRILLLVRGKRQIAMRCMDIIEWSEINNKNENFRMRDGVFSQVNTVECKLPFSGSSYKKDFEYSYIK